LPLAIDIVVFLGDKKNDLLIHTLFKKYIRGLAL